MSEPIDLRSDTVTRPSADMIRAMASARVGDDVYGEDPTVCELEASVADLFGKEAALFVPTGVMSNQLALRVLARQGDEVIVGRESHIFNYETAAPAVLSGIQLHTIADGDGELNVDQIIEAIREPIYYMPRSAVVCSENTHNRAGGLIGRLETHRRIHDICAEHDMAFHLDGARIWNTIVATNIGPEVWGAHPTTISVCMSKGLGAPIGSCLVSSRALIEEARHFRKIWGGGWRQAGMLAAAALYAIRNNLDRLRDDHRNAHLFAHELAASAGVEILRPPITNIVLLRPRLRTLPDFLDRCSRRGVLLSGAFQGKVRAVFHLDVSAADTLIAARAVVDAARPD